MKVLIDECAPKKLWSGKENGELLADAEGRFDALVTVDQNIRYQQNLTERKIAVVVIRASPIVSRTLNRIFPPAF